MQGLISSVKHGSLAETAGIKAGESLLTVNGSSLRDIIDLSFCWQTSRLCLNLPPLTARNAKLRLIKE